MLYFTRFLSVLLLFFVINLCAKAEGNLYGLVVKSTSDSNFIDTLRGCNKAAEEFGDKCYLIGSEGSANPHAQYFSLKKSLEENTLSAVAVSVIRSDLIVKALSTTNIPVITFDSPLDPEHKHLSLNYTGIDNVSFGIDLAKIAKKMRPTGGVLCLMTEKNDTNLAQRVWGVRLELSGERSFSSTQRLSGENGWIEDDRCPWNTGDDANRALKEVEYTLHQVKPDVLISVGHWPIIYPQRYREVVQSSAEALRSKEIVIVVGVGKVLPDYHQLLKDELIHGYVSIDFENTGRSLYKSMKAAVHGLPLKAETYLPSEILISE